LVEDECATLEQLNKLYETKHAIFWGARIPRKRFSMETSNAKGLENKEGKHVDVGKKLNVKSKIFNVRNPKALNHFIKGKIYLSPMETILVILR
jgi:hypothetical protein